ncbi:MAG: hydrogenase maturation nickel metallochaperone HypA [Thermodesulfobacteriota bacterium]
MHEMSLVQNIIDIVEQEMERHGVEQLKAIHLAVGRMSAVVPEQMTLCFEILTSKTKLAGTALKMRMVPITYQCGACEREFTSEGIVSQCPSCSSENLEMIFGRELKIESIEVTD